MIKRLAKHSENKWAILAVLAVAQVDGYQAGLRVGIGLALVASVVVLLVVKNQIVDAREAMAGGA